MSVETVSESEVSDAEISDGMPLDKSFECDEDEAEEELRSLVIKAYKHGLPAHYYHADIFVHHLRASDGSFCVPEEIRLQPTLYDSNVVHAKVKIPSGKDLRFVFLARDKNGALVCVDRFTEMRLKRTIRHKTDEFTSCPLLKPVVPTRLYAPREKCIGDALNRTPIREQDDSDDPDADSIASGSDGDYSAGPFDLSSAREAFLADFERPPLKYTDVTTREVSSAIPEEVFRNYCNTTQLSTYAKDKGKKKKRGFFRAVIPRKDKQSSQVAKTSHVTKINGVYSNYTATF